MGTRSEVGWGEGAMSGLEISLSRDLQRSHHG